ncbi:MAG: ORC1-type DNA replication protein [Nitrososphaerota archaeon]
MRIFKNEEKLSPEYVPSRLPHREEELNLLITFFSTHIYGKKGYSVRVLITGPVGAGKTALSKLFGAKAEEIASHAGVNLRYIHINCKIHTTLFSLLKRVVDALRSPIPGRGLSNEELLHSLMNYLENKRQTLILGLDEVDGLIREEPEALYLLSRISEERDAVPRLSLLMISRNVEVLNILDESTRNLLQNNVLYLSEYNADQLRDIIEYRCSEAFIEGVVTPEVLSLIVDMAAERGDARYAIEVLWRAGKFAENEGVDKVSPEHVRKAAASVYPAIKRENLAHISHHERLILLATTRLLMNGAKSHITSSELYSTYKVACEEYSTFPRGYTRFWEYLQRLEDIGFIRIRVLSEGIRGRRSYITLPEIPASILNRELKALLEKRKE